MLVQSFLPIGVLTLECTVCRHANVVSEMHRRHQHDSLCGTVCVSAQVLARCSLRGRLMGDVDELIADFGSLRVTVRRISQREGVDSAPPAKAAAKAAPPRQDEKAYVVFGCRRAPNLCGIWVCDWAILEARLPGGQLFGSGARLRRYESVGAAEEAWARAFPEEAAPRHP